MSKSYKILIAVLSALTLAVISATLWLLLHTPDSAPSSVPGSAAPAPLSASGEIIINEFMEKNRATLRDADGDFSDWIELYNPSAEALSLSGWHISDKEGVRGWGFPDITLESGAYLIVFASGKNRTASELHTDFSISGDEGLYLTDGTGALRSSALCGDCRKDVSIARSTDGVYAKSTRPTPGFENSADGEDAFQRTLTVSGPLVINEAMSLNLEYLQQGDMSFPDWLEIKNVSASEVRLSDYYLSDDKDDFFLWQLPDVTLAPGQLLLVLCTGDAQELRDGTAFSSFSLNSENDQLYLSAADGTLIDRMALLDIPCGASLGRLGTEPGYYYFAAPSPGEDNSDGRRRIAAMPTASSPDGVFEDVDSVRLELSGAGEIRYTLDGSAPDESSALYTEPLELTATTVVRAAGFEEGALQSRTLSLCYIINEGHTLPVVSLVSDSPADFDGMYSAGQKDVELPGNLSYYGEDGSFSIGCGISMNGMTSLSLAKKNMALRFRGAYGASTLNYDLYGGGVTEFTNLLLRAGQDYYSAIVRNELCQELCSMATDKVINQRSKYVILYVNGQYSGIYTLKEKANEQLYASIAGVSAESVTLLEPPVPFESDFYQEIIKFCIMNDMSLDENYQHICDRVDIDSLIDFLIMEGFCSNTDVTSGNIRFVRSTENDGKWRFEFYDLDSTFIIQGSVYYNLMSEYAENNIQLSAFIVPLMANARFKDAFLTRANQLLRDTLTNEAVISTLDSLAGEIAPEVERDYARYNMELSGWEYNLQYIRDLVNGCNWRQYNIDVLSELFALSDAERAAYFGDIDGK